MLRSAWPAVLLLTTSCASSVAPLWPDGARNPTSDSGTLEASADVPARDAVDVSDSGVVAPPARPLAPLSTATVTSQRPMLRWLAAPGTTGTRVQICRDRACTAVESTGDVSGTSFAPGTPLRAGVHFWRLFGQVGAATGTTPGPTWEFVVGARSAPVDTSWGTMLDVNGDGYTDVIVGAMGTGGNIGRAHVYLGGAGGLAISPASSLNCPDGAGGYFGHSVASAGDINGDGYADVMIGTLDRARERSGLHFYLGSADGLGPSPATSLTIPFSANGNAGKGASAGDVNGDGYADVVIGAPGGIGLGGGTGRMSVFLGGASGLATSPATSVTIPGGGDGPFGHGVASAGDTNGDTYGDVVVDAASWDAETRVFHYRSYVYLGGAGGLSTSPASALIAPSRTNFFSSASAGDVDGDGYADVVTSTDVMTYLYRGSAAGLGTSPATALAAPSQSPGGGVFARRPAAGGDVNGDGYADVLIGLPGTLPRVSVYLGGATGLAATPTVTLTGPDARDMSFGSAIASAVDLNGDGFGDVLVGDRGIAPAGSGHAHVYLGSAAGLATSPAISLTGSDGPDSGFGGSVAGLLVPRSHGSHAPNHRDSPHSNRARRTPSNQSRTSASLLGTSGRALLSRAASSLSNSVVIRGRQASSNETSMATLSPARLRSIKARASGNPCGSIKRVRSASSSPVASR